MKSFLAAIALLAVGGSAAVSVALYREHEALRAELDGLRVEQTTLSAQFEKYGARRSVDPAGTSYLGIPDAPGSLGGETANDVAGAPATEFETDPAAGEVRKLAESVPQDEPAFDKLASLVGERLKEDTNPPEGEAFTAQVRETLAEIRAEEQAERAERRRAQRIENIKERVKSFSERLRLTTYQEEDLIAAFTDNFDQIAKIRDRAEAGEIEWPEARPLMQEQRRATTEQVKQLLAPDQYAEYELIQKEEDENRRNNRWGGPGDSGPPPDAPPPPGN